MSESFVRFSSPMPTSSGSVSQELDNRLQIIEDKLDRILHALSIKDGGSQTSYSRRNKKRSWASSPSGQSDACDDDGDGQTSDDSEGLSERSTFCASSTTTEADIALDILSDRPRMSNRVHRHASSFKRLTGTIQMSS